MTSPGELTKQWVAVYATATGSAHLRRGQPCEDAAGSHGEGPWSALAVADGHGSTRHPRAGRGAAFAVSAALDALIALPNGDLEQVLTQLGKLPVTLHRDWQDRVRADVAGDPLTEEERRAVGTNGPAGDIRAYGSTLLGAAGSERWLALIQLGDGDIIVGRAGQDTASRPTHQREPADPRVTDSLCHADAARRARVALVDLGDKPVDAVLLATDGFGAAFEQSDWHDETIRQLVEAARRMTNEELASAVNDWCEAPAQVGGDDVTLGVLAPSRRNSQ